MVAWDASGAYPLSSSSHALFRFLLFPFLLLLPLGFSSSSTATPSCSSLTFSSFSLPRTNAGGIPSSSNHTFLKSPTLNPADPVCLNSSTRLRTVQSAIFTTWTISCMLLRKLFIRAAMSSAAPHIPEGRRPRDSQSRSIRATSRVASTAT